MIMIIMVMMKIMTIFYIHDHGNDDDGEVDEQVLPSLGFGTQSDYCTGSFPSPLNSSFIFNIHTFTNVRQCSKNFWHFQFVFQKFGWLNAVYDMKMVI